MRLGDVPPKRGQDFLIIRREEQGLPLPLSVHGRRRGPGAKVPGEDDGGRRPREEEPGSFADETSLRYGLGIENAAEAS